MVFLILLFSVLWVILDKVPVIGDNNFVQLIISLGISLITIRFLAGNPAWYETILLPNTALGVTILAIVPLIVYFFFVQDVGDGKPTLRKILWIVAAVIFFFLYVVRVEKIKETVQSGFNPAHVFLFSIIACIVFLVMDGTIKKAWNKIKAEKTASMIGREQILHIKETMERVKKAYLRNTDKYESIYTNARGRKGYEADMNALKEKLQALKSS